MKKKVKTTLREFIEHLKASRDWQSEFDIFIHSKATGVTETQLICAWIKRYVRKEFKAEKQMLIDELTIKDSL